MTLQTVNHAGTVFAALVALGLLVAAVVRRRDPYVPWWVLVACAGLFVADGVLRLAGHPIVGAAVVWVGVLALFVCAWVTKRNTRRIRAESARIRAENEEKARQIGLDLADIEALRSRPYVQRYLHRGLN